ncbi:MAG: N-acetylgalactosamine-6-sulfatase [Gemmatales bacterium]|nr:MAG: N-acetylgalactosamine-6-sulfatase [Gemmatales bacterium]
MREAALTLVLLTWASGPLAADKPNIVLVMADDQGWGDVHYNGDPHLKTPNLDDLAATGLRFDRFYAAAPVCSPTRGSVMTGRHPNRFGCFKWGHTLRPQEVTIAEALKTVGYRTGHFGKWHLGSVRKGSPVNPGASGFDRWVSAPNFFDNDPILSDQGKAIRTTGESSLVTADFAIDFIRQCVKDKQTPFLAVVWFGSPHSPHRAAEEFRKLYPDLPANKQNFYGEISGLDAAVGKLRAELKKLGIRENTLFWYCSDNGALPVGSTGGHRGRKGQVYEGGLLVPAVIEWPARIRAPRTTSVRCNTSDIYPTLVEITGAKVKKQPPLDGISLVPLLDGKMASRPKPMGFWDYPIGGISTPSAKWMAELYKAQQAGKEPDDKQKLRLDAGEIRRKYPLDKFPGHAAWIAGDWKLHRIEKNNKVAFELYNLVSDRAEKNDLAQKEPERVKAMATALEKWQRSVVRSLNGEDY